MAFGDLFLHDVRQYRITLLQGTGIDPLFPLWEDGLHTSQLARAMIQAGLKAVLTCVDPSQLPRDFLGREFNEEFLSDIPSTVDPCGENGEFHTFCFDGPMFGRPIELVMGEKIEREGFWFADAVPVGVGGQTASSSISRK